MTIVRNKRRQLVWKIVKDLTQGESWPDMLAAAYAVAKEYKVPYMPNLKRNHPVTMTEKLILANMGITCPKK